MSEQLRNALIGAANYIDTLGGDSKAYRAALSTHHAAPGAPQQKKWAMCTETETPCSVCPTAGTPCAAAATPVVTVTDQQIATLKSQFGVTSSGRGIKEFTQVKDFALAVIALTAASRAAATAPAGHGSAEDLYVAQSEHLNCPACGGSGHVGDATAPAGGVTEDMREFLGKLVRLEWTRWAAEQPNPKPSWLKPWTELDEPDKEVDRRIGEAIWRFSFARDAALTTAARAAEPAIQLGADGQKVFAETLLNPPPPTAAFLKAEERYSNLAQPETTAPAGGVTDEQIDAAAAPWLCPDGQANPSDVRQIVRAVLALTTAARAAEPRVELDERAAFEKFAADNGLDLRRLGALGPDHIAYASTATRESWRAWQRALSWRDRAVSKPIGHLHSNGDFCVESMPASTEWPIALYAAARAAEPARKPLTKDQIDFILRDAFLAANGSVYSTRIYDFVREIEREHGIATSPTPPTGTSKEGGEKP